MTKKTEKGNKPISIDNGGEVKDYLENGNIIYCDMKAEEYWIKTSLNLLTNSKKLSISLDIKVKAEMSLLKLKYLLIKMGLNFWVDFCKNDSFHYLLLNAKCELLNAKQNMILDIGELTKKSVNDDRIFLFK